MPSWQRWQRCGPSSGCRETEGDTMSDLQQLYQEVILDHAKRRCGNLPLTGAPESGDVMFGASHQVNPTCGDEITVEALYTPAAGRLHMRWDGAGCSISMASASVLAEMLDELTPDRFAEVEAGFHELMHSRGRGRADEELLGDAAAFEGVSKFPARVKCALLAWVAFKDAFVQAQAAAEGR